MLVHHPELFGDVSEEDTEAYEAWQSQFAWATAVVNVRSMMVNDGEGSTLPHPPASATTHCGNAYPWSLCALVVLVLVPVQADRSPVVCHSQTPCEAWCPCWT